MADRRRSVLLQNYRTALRFRDRGVSGDLETPRMRANASLLIPRRHLLLASSLARTPGYKSARTRAQRRALRSPMQPHAAREECKCRATGYRYSLGRYFLQISRHLH